MSETTARHIRWDDLEPDHVTESIARRLVTGERAMMAQITLERGAIVPSHRHVSEQLTYVLTGALRFTIDGCDTVVRSGEVLLIPSDVPHQAEAIEDTCELDVFSPIREDWLNGTDDYFRR